MYTGNWEVLTSSLLSYYQPIGEYMRASLVWPCTRNYTTDRPLLLECRQCICQLNIISVFQCSVHIRFPISIVFQNILAASTKLLLRGLLHWKLISKFLFQYDNDNFTLNYQNRYDTIISRRKYQNWIQYDNLQIELSKFDMIR